MLIDETLVSEFCASIKSINIHKSKDAYPSIYALDVREDTEGPAVFSPALGCAVATPV